MKKLIPVLFLLLPLSIMAQSVTLKPVCSVSFMRGGKGSVRLNGYLYSLDYYNALQKTNLSTGETTKLGKEFFTDVRFFFGLRNKLYIVESSGATKQIDTNTGEWNLIMSSGSWVEVSRIITVGNNLYSVKNGTLCQHYTFNSEKYKELGDPEFFTSMALMYTDSTLHSVIDKTVYRIEINTGEWKKLSTDKAWRNFAAGAVIGTKLYSVENPSSLVVTTLKDGLRKVLDEKQFMQARMLFPDNGKLYYVNNNYDLFEVVIDEAAPKPAS